MKKSEWRFLLYWVLATLGGHTIHQILIYYFRRSPTFDNIINIVMSVIPQWIVLRSRFRHPWLWVLFNALGIFVFSLIPAIRLPQNLEGFSYTLVIFIQQTFIILFFAFFQWLSLRLESARANWWFIIKAGIALVSYLFSYAYMIIQPNFLNRSEISKENLLIDNLVIGIPGAILIGLALIWLLRDPITFEDDLEAEAG